MYFSGFYFYYTDYYILFQIFNYLYLALIIKSEKILFLSIKLAYLSIIKNIFEKIIVQLTRLFEDLNINTRFKIVWIGFLYLSKIIYMVTKLKKIYIYGNPYN